MLSSESLLEERASQRQLGIHVVAAVFDGAGQAAFALADGTVRLASSADQAWRSISVADGAVLDMARDAAATGFVCSGDDGSVVRLSGDGGVVSLMRQPGKWVEHVASFVHPRAPLVACSVGKKLHLFDGSGALLKTLEHPSTVTGIAFDAKGKRIAASHYSGASLWYVASKTDNPRRLDWKGSHTAIALHPGGEALVTAMQENALHGWRLADGQHMQMSGYPSKTESMSFTRTGKWLATSGADSVIVWPFFGGGPMGRAPLELAGTADVLCTRVACNPHNDLCAAGFSNGRVVLIDLDTRRVLPVAPATGGVVSALAWSTNGAFLAFGTEQGFAALIDFSQR